MIRQLLRSMSTVKNIDPSTYPPCSVHSSQYVEKKLPPNHRISKLFVYDKRTGTFNTVLSKKTKSSKPSKD